MLALALVIKVLVPSGFMPVAADGHLRVSLCSAGASMTMIMAESGTKHHRKDGQTGDTQGSPCAFSLFTQALAATDPVLLIGAILFIPALSVLAWAPFADASPHDLRPPPRAPPLPG